MSSCFSGVFVWAALYMTESNIPLKRGAEPEEVSKLVLFLAEDASYSTGSEFVVDGGLTAKF